MAATRAFLGRAWLAVWALDLCLMCHVLSDSAFLLSEPQDFDEVCVFGRAHMPPLNREQCQRDVGTFFPTGIRIRAVLAGAIHVVARTRRGG